MLKVKEYQQRLLEGVKQVMASNNFQEFMRFSAKFHSYSFGNILMIWSQRKDASRVAGIKTWNSLGRFIRKGEKGIAIFAPLLKRQKEDDTDNKENSKEERLIGFRPVYVFDISQTEGKPLPELEIGKPSMEDHGDAEELFRKILAASPVPVDFEDMQPGRKGYYAVQEKKIALSTSLKSPEKCKTILHELAHHLTYEGKIDGLDRADKEVIAEGAAFMAAAYFGLDSSAYSFAYLAAWGQDYKKIFEACQTMHDIATKLIEMIDTAQTIQA